MEQFYTLQGEGFFAGQAAYFIRLAGCDVGCVWCDVKESWDASKYPSVSVDTLVQAALKHPARIVVITGGEPAMYNISALCNALHENGFRVHIETSGAYPIEGNFDWITLSPKKFKAPLHANMQMANELKVVIYNKSDFDWAEQHALSVNRNCRLYLQAEWSKREQINPLLTAYIQDNPKWQLSLQTHKYLNIP
jgi:organic radical activating enzyme